jgi:Arm domain-containing DNA-binding protein
VKNIKSTPPRKISDNGGLFLMVTATGSKLLRLNYRFPKGGKQKTLAIGIYPAVSLAKARAQRDAAKVCCWRTAPTQALTRESLPLNAAAR